MMWKTVELKQRKINFRLKIIGDYFAKDKV